MADFPTPRLPAGVRRLFRWPFRRMRDIERDVDEEVRFHLDQRTEELIAAGAPAASAQAEARRRFGDLEDLRAFCRAVERPTVIRSRLASWLADLAQDLRFTGRQFRRSPGFAAVAVATLGLGIGATTTIFCAVHDILLTPLPYRHADRLVSIDESGFHGKVWLAPARGVVDAWRSGNRTLEGIVETSGKQWTLGGSGQPEAVDGEAIAPDVLPFLGVSPLLGRAFTAQDARAGAAPVALVAEGLWRRRFGASRAALGREITLDGRPYTVVGVMPRLFGIGLFYGLDGPQVMVPLTSGPPSDRVDALGRLRPGVTMDEAARDLGAIRVSDPGMETPGAHLTGVGDDFRTWYQSTLTLLLGAVALVLLIACTNVANLLVMRSWSRMREVGIRVAIGAGRARLLRQLLTESTVLGLSGGMLGTLMAWKAIPVLAALRPRSPTTAALATVRLDPAVLLFAVGVALAAGVAFGFAPAFVAARPDIGDVLKGAAPAAGSRPAARRLRSALVIAEIAVSVVLLTGAGLLVRSLLTWTAAGQGLYPRGLSAVQLAFPPDRFPSPSARSEILARIVDRVRGMPGVEAATEALMPPWGRGAILPDLHVEGRPQTPAPGPGLVGFNWVAPEYFRIAGIPLLAGQPFDPDTSEHGAVVGRAFAARYLPSGAWLGARIRFGDTGPWSTVVGVVADPRFPGDTGAPSTPMVYEPFLGNFPSVTILVRCANAAALLPFITRSIMLMDPGVHLVRAQTVRMALAEMWTDQRFLMTVLSAFAVLALVLAAVGLYGVVAYSVRQRTHEIGVRVALGAAGPDVVGMVLRQSIGLALSGVVLGLAGAAAATRLIRSQLYHVRATDPLTYLAVGGILAAVALLASYVPARAALRIDPVDALRGDG